ncbi:unnamed protein product [Coregonus sp. 'balchen']|nr:unnamed protein product [Coregonus sp. 'balchen']
MCTAHCAIVVSSLFFFVFQIITHYVYELLETKCNLTKEIVPVDATEEEPRSFIYLSADAMSNPAKLLVLIQGGGVVRAGQWARRLIINEDLDSGTQIPFITRAQEVGAPPTRVTLRVTCQGYRGVRLAGVVGVTMGWLFRLCLGMGLVCLCEWQNWVWPRDLW